MSGDALTVRGLIEELLCMPMGAEVRLSWDSAVYGDGNEVSQPADGPGVTNATEADGYVVLWPDCDGWPGHAAEVAS